MGCRADMYVGIHMYTGRPWKGGTDQASDQPSNRQTKPTQPSTKHTASQPTNRTNQEPLRLTLTEIIRQVHTPFLVIEPWWYPYISGYFYIPICMFAMPQSCSRLEHAFVCGPTRMRQFTLTNSTLKANTFSKHHHILSILQQTRSDGP